MLGHNFPKSSWYKDAHALLKSGGVSPQANGGWFANIIKPQQAKQPDVAPQPVPQGLPSPSELPAPRLPVPKVRIFQPRARTNRSPWGLEWFRPHRVPWRSNLRHEGEFQTAAAMPPFFVSGRALPILPAAFVDGCTPIGGARCERIVGGATLLKGEGCRAHGERFTIPNQDANVS